MLYEWKGADAIVAMIYKLNKQKHEQTNHRFRCPKGHRNDEMPLFQKGMLP